MFLYVQKTGYLGLGAPGGPYTNGTDYGIIIDYMLIIKGFL